MKKGLISLDFRRYSIESCFRFASENGYDGVELWGGRPHAYPPDVLKRDSGEILKEAKRFHLELPMYTPNAIGLPVNLCSPLAFEREEGLLYYQEAVEAAARLQISKVLVVADHPGYETSVDDARKWFADAVEHLMRVASKYGITISVEPLTPMESPVITTADDCLRLMKSVSGKNLDFVLDIVPAAVMYDPISSYFMKLGRERIGHVHICNTDGMTDAHLLPRQGILDYAALLEELSAVWHYDGYVIRELYSSSARDPVAAIVSAR